MKAGLVTGLRRFELVDVPEPAARPGVAVAAIALCGICGTDVHGFASAEPYNPAICGHEWVGTVIATGDGVTNVARGRPRRAGQRAGLRCVPGVPLRPAGLLRRRRSSASSAGMRWPRPTGRSRPGSPSTPAAWSPCRRR